MTGSGAFQWHVTFNSLKNAGDLSAMTAEFESSDALLLGTNASIKVFESRKGTTGAIFKISIP
eukprot:2234996-Ditylum_brightwellii.AAC.1